jgi:hypothetical protein
MEVLIMFIVFAIMFAWALPQEEIDELNEKFKKK